MRALLVSDGSGGHLIPALQVAQALARRGARPTLWYAHRPRIASLAEQLSRSARVQGVEITPIPLTASGWPEKLWQCGRLWRRAQRWFDATSTDVVVGFGGWVSGPVLLAARQRGIGCLVHEQNVRLGRANRWLAPWMDRIAVSFKDTQSALPGRLSFVTGLPVREGIGRCSRAQAAARFGLEPSAPTLAVLGGSQGARAINRLVAQSVQALTDAERGEWQFLHLAGTADESAVREAYAAAGARAWVGAHAADMEAVYAAADVAIARAGASTIAELARCGVPAVLIPYPHAGAHQRVNAALIASKGGGVMIEESEATPEGLLGTLRLLLHDERMRTTMGLRMREMSCDDAAERLSDAILQLAEDTPSGRRSAPALSLRPAESVPRLGFASLGTTPSKGLPSEPMARVEGSAR